MAGQALGVFVFAEQRKTRQAMIEEDVLCPRGFVVAVLASCSLGSLVRIIFLVTVAATHRRLSVKQRFDMTTSTFYIGMRTLEDVSGVDVVIKRKLRPLVRDMACFATLPKVPLVIIVALMARETGCGQLISKWVITMAVTAH